MQRNKKEACINLIGQPIKIYFQIWLENEHLKIQNFSVGGF